ncbi:kinase-like protein [Glonium stellatum]|uniref:non-specific serine/threonine protein kinase n=1 Tax=Glonium stellatum TaxID=574774 RepID=A0A8E2F515_9PEZI|nr:kinase-like protein [Glonium stellatum]
MSESEVVHAPRRLQSAHTPRRPQAAHTHRRPPVDHDHAHALIEYQNWLNDACIASSGCLTPESTDADHRFVPKPDLQDYLSKDKLIKILKGLGIQPHNTDTILKDYLKSFAILLSLGHGPFIEWFLQYDSLADKKLPFETRPPTFPRTSDVDFFDNFFKRQWMFCNPIFSCRKHHAWALNDNYILPIINKEELGRGGSSVTYKITLHPYYDRLAERSDQTKENKFANVYVLKTYNTHDADTRYRKELAAFIHLRNMQQSTRSVIQFYGSFKHRGTYNLILEYADKGTLEQYFETTERPSSGPEIRKFWESILQLAKGLSRIHEVEATDPNDSEVVHGWHQDVKPENILVSTRSGKLEFECEFKLADLGLSHFKIAEGDTEDRDSRGTRTYGAPECYRRNAFQAKSRLKVTQRVDIWSLGCVLSEAAVWVVRGKIGLDKYRRERREEMEQKDPDFTDLGCFHDGTEVLRVVTETHELLREDLPRSDKITEGVLELVQRMLKKVQYRPTAYELVDMVEDTLKKSQKQRISHQPHDSGKAEVSSPIRAKSVPIPQHSPGMSKGRSGMQPSPRIYYGSGEYHGLSPGLMKDGLWITEEPQSKSPDMITGFEERNGDQSFNAGFSVPDPYYQGVPSSRAESANVENRGSSTLTGSSGYFQSQDSHVMSALNPFQVDAVGSIMKSPRTPSKPLTDRKRAFSDSYNNIMDEERGIAYQKNASRNPSVSPGPSSAYSPPIQPSPMSPFKDSYSTVSSAMDSNISDRPPNRVVVIQHDPQRSEASRTDLPRDNSTDAKEKSPATPFISFEDAYKWRLARQKRSKDELCAEHVLERLNHRDHVFIVDNSPSMRPHWSQVIKVLDLLAYITKEKDPNGLELYFTMKAGRHSGSKSTDLVKKAQSRKAREGATDLSDLYPRIRDIFGEYKKNLKRKPLWGSARRPMSLYILTDGNWQPQRDTEICIAELVRALDESDQYQVGIEFIQFGNHAVGTDRLKHLDDGLKREFGLKWDIIDTEPAEGNVLKMLLGAINKWYDAD